MTLSHTSEKTFGEQVRTIAIDCTQNIDRPRVGRQQAGDTCHFSLLNAFAFGAVDNIKHDPEEMACHCCGEEDGRKGADNVCSVSLHFLASDNWLREDETGKALCVVADDHCGQNKNSTVICLMSHLVEMEYFETACVTFLGTHKIVVMECST